VDVAFARLLSPPPTPSPSSFVVPPPVVVGNAAAEAGGAGGGWYTSRISSSKPRTRVIGSALRPILRNSAANRASVPANTGDGRSDIRRAMASSLLAARPLAAKSAAAVVDVGSSAA